ELLAADEVGDRAALDAPADEVAVLLARLLARGVAVARAVEVDALAAEGVGQQHLGVQARELHALLRQEAGRPVEQPADRPGRFRAHGGLVISRRRPAPGAVSCRSP